MSWNSGSWMQDDAINGGYPMPIDTSPPIPFDVERLYTEWKISPLVNNGYPYIVPILEKKPVSIPRILPPLIVYNSTETQFKTNGLRILSPISATYEVEEDQAGDIVVHCPCDEDGDWTALRVSNIILAPVFRRGIYKPQPFRIHKIVKKRNGNGATVTAYARHVFYDLSYMVVDDVNPDNHTAEEAIGYVLENINTDSDSFPRFSYASDIEERKAAQFQGVTVANAIIGSDNSILHRWDGEFYVDGYYFSICRRSEGALDDAFSIQYHVDMTEIEETVDNTNTYSRLVGIDNFGRTATGSIPLWYNGLPFEKTLYAKFSYSSYSVESANQFGEDFIAYMSMIQELMVSYTVRFAELPNTSEYDGFLNLSSLEVGDTGLIEDDGLEITTKQRIIRKSVDLLTNSTISITLGNTKRSISRKQPFSNIVSIGSNPMEKELAATIITTISANIVSLQTQVISKLETFTINQLQGV